MPDYQSKIDAVLDVLNHAELRATYSAVGEFAGLPAISVSQFLGAPRPEASWVVAKSSGLPNGYARHQRHSRLSDNPNIMVSGRELARLIEEHTTASSNEEATKTIRRIAGVDLAWNSERNGSGLALGRLTSRGLMIERARGGIVGLQALKDALSAQEPLAGVAVDAPLIIKNRSGARLCEKALSSVYNQRWAGCHPCNLKVLPDASSVKLSRWLTGEGFEHLDRGAQWQIEVYPHPAIVEIFSLDRRLAYKKGNAQEKRSGQTKLAKLLSSLANNEELPLLLSEELAGALTADYVAALPSARLKDNEDMLDAIVCCYIGALYDLGRTRQVFGDTETGYIVVP